VSDPPSETRQVPCRLTPEGRSRPRCAGACSHGVRPFMPRPCTSAMTRTLTPTAVGLNTRPSHAAEIRFARLPHVGLVVARPGSGPMSLPFRSTRMRVGSTVECRVFSARIPALLALVDTAYGRAVAEETREETRGESLPAFACLQTTIDASHMTRVASRQEDGHRHARLHLHAEARPSWRALGQRFVPPEILTSGPQPGRERPRVWNEEVFPGSSCGVAHVLAAL
jgi:hypothetical protein